MDIDRQIAEKVEDILKNHDQEVRTIEVQIDAERAALESDLEDIRARAYPSAFSLDGVRVQSSADPDRKMVKIMDAIIRREERTTRAIAVLEDRRRQIESVYHHVLSLDARSKCVILALYYPYRTYDDAAFMLEVDTSTVTRWRRDAIKYLAQRVKKHFSDV